MKEGLSEIIEELWYLSTISDKLVGKDYEYLDQAISLLKKLRRSLEEKENE